MPNEEKNKPEAVVRQKHVCGLESKEFATEQLYLNHVCAVTGFKPTDPEHQGTRFIYQSKKALERTGSLTTEKSAELDSAMQRAKDNGVDSKRVDAQKEKRRKK